MRAPDFAACRPHPQQVCRLEACRYSFIAFCIYFRLLHIFLACCVCHSTHVGCPLSPLLTFEICKLRSPNESPPYFEGFEKEVEMRLLVFNLKD